MYLAMNRFNVKPEREAEWEQIWKERESFLADVPGFRQFMLLRSAEEGEYISYSAWDSPEAFHAWTRSENFRLAHGQRNLADVLAGPPQLGLYEPVINETSETREVSDAPPEPGRRGPRH